MKPVFNFKSSSVLIPVNESILREKIEASISKGESEESELDNILTRLLDYHGPFGINIEFNYSLNADRQEMILTETKTRVVIDSAGRDIDTIILDQKPPQGKRVAPRKYLKALKEYFVKGMMENMSVSGNDKRKVIEAGGKGNKVGVDLSERCRLALGGILYQSIMELLDVPMSVEVTRTLGRNQLNIVAVAVPPLAESDNVAEKIKTDSTDNPAKND